MQKRKSALFISLLFIMSLLVASTASAAMQLPFASDRYIISGQGGELGKVGAGAYFGTDLSTPGTSNGNTNPATAPSYLPVFSKGQQPSSFAGGSGGDITFGDKTSEYTFEGRLMLLGGKGGTSQSTGVGANGGNARIYAKNLFISSDFSVLAGTAGNGGKGGNVLIETSGNVFLGGKFLAYGGDTGKGQTGNTNIKIEILSTGSGASFVRTGNNMHIDIDTLSATGKENVFLFQSTGSSRDGFLKADIDKLVVEGSTILNLVGTRKNAKIYPHLDKVESEVKIDEILIKPGANLAITRNNGDFDFETLCAETGAFLASDLPLADKELEFILPDSRINAGSTILLNAEVLDVTGLKDVGIKIYTPLTNLQKGDSIILVSKATGKFADKKISVDLPKRDNLYTFKVELKKNQLVATML